MLVYQDLIFCLNLGVISSAGLCCWDEILCYICSVGTAANLALKQKALKVSI